eukprot:g608.t1
MSSSSELEDDQQRDVSSSDDDDDLLLAFGKPGPSSSSSIGTSLSADSVGKGRESSLSADSVGKGRESLGRGRRISRKVKLHNVTEQQKKRPLGEFNGSDNDILLESLLRKKRKKENERLKIEAREIALDQAATKIASSEASRDREEEAKAAEKLRYDAHHLVGSAATAPSQFFKQWNESKIQLFFCPIPEISIAVQRTVFRQLKNAEVALVKRWLKATGAKVDDGRKKIGKFSNVMKRSARLRIGRGSSASRLSNGSKQQKSQELSLAEILWNENFANIVLHLRQLGRNDEAEVTSGNNANNGSDYLSLFCAGVMKWLYQCIILHYETIICEGAFCVLRRILSGDMSSFYLCNSSRIDSILLGRDFSQNFAMLRDINCKEEGKKYLLNVPWRLDFDDISFGLEILGYEEKGKSSIRSRKQRDRTLSSSSQDGEEIGVKMSCSSDLLEYFIGDRVVGNYKNLGTWYSAIIRGKRKNEEGKYVYEIVYDIDMCIELDVSNVCLKPRIDSMKSFPGRKLAMFVRTICFFLCFSNFRHGNRENLYKQYLQLVSLCCDLLLDPVVLRNCNGMPARLNCDISHLLCILFDRLCLLDTEDSKWQNNVLDCVLQSSEGIGGRLLHLLEQFPVQSRRSKQVRASFSFYVAKQLLQNEQIVPLKEKCFPPFPLSSLELYQFLRGIPVKRFQVEAFQKDVKENGVNSLSWAVNLNIIFRCVTECIMYASGPYAPFKSMIETDENEKEESSRDASRSGSTTSSTTTITDDNDFLKHPQEMIGHFFRILRKWKNYLPSLKDLQDDEEGLKTHDVLGKIMEQLQPMVAARGSTPLNWAS